MKFNFALYPPDGYVFRDTAGVLHKGRGVKDLFARISSYRKLNQLAPGDPPQEVNDQWCSKFPGYCRSAAVVPRRTLGPGCTSCKKVKVPRR